MLNTKFVAASCENSSICYFQQTTCHIFCSRHSNSTPVFVGFDLNRDFYNQIFCLIHFHVNVTKYKWTFSQIIHLEKKAYFTK